MAASVALLLTALVVGQFYARHVQGDIGITPLQGQPPGSTPPPQLAVQVTCPPGFQPIGFREEPGYACEVDPCYVNPCGPGNTCKAILPVGDNARPDCTCNPPYQRALVSAPNSRFGIQYGVCYVPGQDVCNPSPCQNGGTCAYNTDSNGNPLVDPQGNKIDFVCTCPPNWTGKTCGFSVPNPYPQPTATVNGVSGPLATAIPADLPVCGENFPPVGCLYADNSHFLCCDQTSTCGPLGSDGVPICPGPSYVPSPNIYNENGPPYVVGAPPTGPSGDQGFCGTGDAAIFPNRCWFNSDPLGRYVCCDNQGCSGFNADNLTPHCANYGYVPPNFGQSGPTPPTSSPPSTPPSTPPTGDQGVCGTGDAAIFPNRCWFNSDPLGRYVCCDNQGCNGFNADNLTPHCANYGYVPPNFGLSGDPSPPSTPPSTPPSGSQGVCGSGSAAYFPTRCWFNNDPQGRYVCCDSQGCNGFNADNLTPHCANFGYVPPGYGLG